MGFGDVAAALMLPSLPRRTAVLTPAARRAPFMTYMYNYICKCFEKAKLQIDFHQSVLIYRVIGLKTHLLRCLLNCQIIKPI